MSVSSGLVQGYQPNVYRTVTTGDLKAGISGAPKRCAAMIVFTNAHATNAETAVFTGPDAVNVTVTVPAMSQSQPFYGNISTLGAVGADITAVAGWIDDGTIQPTP